MPDPTQGTQPSLLTAGTGVSDLRPDLLTHLQPQDLDLLFKDESISLALLAKNDQVILEASAGLCQTLGYSRAELIGHTPLELGLFDDGVAFSSLVANFHSASLLLYYHITLHTKTALAVPFILSVFPVEAKDTRCVCAVLENPLSFMELDSSITSIEPIYSIMLDHSPEAICLSSHGNYLHSNAAFLKLFGYTQDAELIGHSLFELISPEGLGSIDETIRMFIQKKDSFHALKLHVLRKDGSAMDVEILTTTFNIQGEIYNLSTLRDISEVKQAQSQLQFTRYAFDRINDSAFWLDQNGTFLDANDATCSKLEYTFAELMAMNITDIFSNYTLASWARHWNTLKNNGHELFEGQAVSKSGALIPVEVNASFLCFDNREYAFFMARDISNRIKRARVLAESQQLIETIMENSSDIILSVDAKDFSLTSFNSAGSEYFQKYHGITLQLGMTLDEMGVFPHFEKLCTNYFKRSVQEGTFSAEYSSPLSKKIFILCLNALKNGPTVFGVSLIAKDITEIRQAEAIQRQQAQNLTSILEATSTGTWELNLKNNKMTISPQYARNLGYDSTDIIPDQASWLKLVHPDDRELVNRTRESHLQNGQPYWVEYRMLKKTGEWHWVLSRGLLIERGTDGKPLRMVGTHYDIDEEKKAQDALHESEAIFRTIFEYARVGVSLVDDQGRYLRTNQTLCDITGYTAQELLTKKFQDITFSEDKAFGASTFQRLVEGEIDQANFEKRYVHKDGHLIWVYLTLGVVRDQNGRYLYSVVYTQDISARKNAEGKLEKQNRELASLNAQLEDHVADLTSLRTVDSAIASSFDLQFILNVLLIQVIKRMNVTAADALAFNVTTQLAHCLETEGFSLTHPNTSTSQFDYPYARQLFHSKKMLKIDHLDQEYYFHDWAEPYVQQGFSAYLALPLINKNEVIGVLELFDKKPISLNREQLSFLETISRQAAIAIDSTGLFEKLQFSNMQLMLAYDEVVDAWASMLDAREMAPEGHSQRLCDLTVQLAKEMGIKADDLLQVKRGALLHNVGKIILPDTILQKTDPLTDEEEAVMRQHPQLGYDMLKMVSTLFPAVEIPYAHHEAWDGSGFPRGLKGEQIPLAARIFTVVDVWEAMTVPKSFRPVYSKEQAMEYIRRQAGIRFDPQVVDLFFKRLY